VNYDYSKLEHCIHYRRVVCHLRMHTVPLVPSVDTIEDYRPDRDLSKLDVDKGKAEEQSGMDIRYQEELHRYLDRVQTLKDGMNQAYSLIFSTYCSNCPPHNRP